MTRRLPDDRTRHLSADERVQVRHLVVPERSQALGLTANAIDASTHLDIIREPKEAIVGWLDGHSAIVIDDGSGLAQAAIDKLQDSAIPTVVVHEDRGDDR